MAVEFDLASATIAIDAAGANTQVNFFKSQSAGGRKFALFDMKRGHSFLQDGHGFAFTLEGTTKLKPGFDLNELKKWRFGFVQMAAAKKLRLIYLGRTQKEGHVEVDLGSDIGSNFILDKFEKSPVPFILPPNADELDGEVSAKMGDHPFISVAHQLRNQKTGNLNTLFKLDYEMSFVSAWVGKDPTGKLVPFAHVEWTLSYDSEFQIVNGVVVARARHGGLRFSAVQRGGHPKIPADPKPPIANDVSRRALKADFLPGSKFRFDGLFYPPSAPDNFVFDVSPAGR